MAVVICRHQEATSAPSIPSSPRATACSLGLSKAPSLARIREFISSGAVGVVIELGGGWGQAGCLLAWLMRFKEFQLLQLNHKEPNHAYIYDRAS